jgi:sugar-specific transcriptional regulator TrmB
MVRSGPSGTVGAVSTERTVELLKDAGFSGYEAKAYIALLASGVPVNGYEVAKASGVPRSTVYETLGKLVARGAAFEVKVDSDAVSYVPLAVDALIGRLRRQTHSTIDGLERALPQIGAAVTARVVQHLSGRADVIARSIDVIESAKRSVWLSIWPDESVEFVSAVDQAIARGVDSFTIAYGDVGSLAGRVYTHSFSAPDVVLERLGCRMSIVIADHDQAVIAGFTGDDVWGIWSDDRVVALLAAEHVRHDIALQLTAEHLEAVGLTDFWARDPDLEALRDAATLGIVSAFKDS